MELSCIYCVNGSFFFYTSFYLPFSTSLPLLNFLFFLLFGLVDQKLCPWRLYYYSINPILSKLHPLKATGY